MLCQPLFFREQKLRHLLGDFLHRGLEAILCHSQSAYELLDRERFHVAKHLDTDRYLIVACQHHTEEFLDNTTVVNLLFVGVS